MSSKEFERIDVLRQECAKTLFGLIGSVAKETRFTSRAIALITSTVVLYGLRFLRGL